MKRLALFVFFAAYAFAEADRYLVKWTTIEKCHECPTRYLMLCGTKDPDCNTPTKTVTHYREFDTLKDALEFSNPEEHIAAMDRAGEGWISSVTTVWTVQPQPEAPPKSSSQVVGIFLVKEIPIEKGMTRVEIPQPPKIEERFSVKVKQ